MNKLLNYLQKQGKTKSKFQFATSRENLCQLETIKLFTNAVQIYLSSANLKKLLKWVGSFKHFV